MLWGVMIADGLFSELEAGFAADVAKQLKLSEEDVEQAKHKVEAGEV